MKITVDLKESEIKALDAMVDEAETVLPTLPKDQLLLTLARDAQVKIWNAWEEARYKVTP